ncbi:hypothetical protein SAMN04488550_4157 [Gordonia malaquae]|uniref:Uncharacterized protein n=1 Tax=Gordonia malaquae NBRC 108250 TaxID=1223542 RepID=M3VCA7_GORML|nr:hypothetical protein [Gordonia malaquae]GAC81683.1 hypothetical protein GM1_041_00540 [Gordonia malaquae NBRC 108250]SEE25668.1 hypothetical protein SAMN04488550_4157 [Gordonia malaquae]
MTSLEQHLADHAQSTRYVDGAPRCACKCGKWIASIVERGPVKAHRHHVADTWREVRTVRAVEELDALPIGTVVQEDEYRHTWIRHSKKWHCSCDGTYVEWSSAGAFEELERRPLTILWTPEDGAL